MERSSVSAGRIASRCKTQEVSPRRHGIAQAGETTISSDVALTHFGIEPIISLGFIELSFLHHRNTDEGERRHVFGQGLLKLRNGGCRNLGDLWRRGGNHHRERIVLSRNLQLGSVKHGRLKSNHNFALALYERRGYDDLLAYDVDNLFNGGYNLNGTRRGDGNIIVERNGGHGLRYNIRNNGSGNDNNRLFLRLALWLRLHLSHNFGPCLRHDLCLHFRNDFGFDLRHDNCNLRLRRNNNRLGHWLSLYHNRLRLCRNDYSFRLCLDYNGLRFGYNDRLFNHDHFRLVCNCHHCWTISNNNCRLLRNDRLGCNRRNTLDQWLVNRNDYRLLLRRYCLDNRLVGRNDYSLLLWSSNLDCWLIGRDNHRLLFRRHNRLLYDNRLFRNNRLCSLGYWHWLFNHDHFRLVCDCHYCWTIRNNYCRLLRNNRLGSNRRNILDYWFGNLNDYRLLLRRNCINNRLVSQNHHRLLLWSSNLDCRLIGRNEYSLLFSRYNRLIHCDRLFRCNCDFRLRCNDNGFRRCSSDYCLRLFDNDRLDSLDYGLFNHDHFSLICNFHYCWPISNNCRLLCNDRLGCNRRNILDQWLVNRNGYRLFLCRNSLNHRLVGRDDYRLLFRRHNRLIHYDRLFRCNCNLRLRCDDDGFRLFDNDRLDGRNHCLFCHNHFWLVCNCHDCRTINNCRLVRHDSLDSNRRNTRNHWLDNLNNYRLLFRRNNCDFGLSRDNNLLVHNNRLGS